MRRRMPSLFAILIALVVILGVSDALAQGCAMCGSAVGEDDPLAGALNVSILFLLTTPYALCAGAAGWFWYHLRRRGPRGRAPVVAFPTAGVKEE